MSSPKKPHMCGEPVDGAQAPAIEAGSRTEKGRFAPGKSGNPGGRVARENKQLREKLQRDGGQVIDVVLAEALKGDMAACRLILDRLVPALKPTAAPVSIDLPEQAGIAGVARAFIVAAASGAMPADVAAQMVGAVASLARITEIDELAQRLDALEALNHG